MKGPNEGPFSLKIADELRCLHEEEMVERSGSLSNLLAKLL